MHRILQRQLKKLALDENTFPKNEGQWQAFLQRIDLAYTQADEGRYTLKRSGDIAEREQVIFNEGLHDAQKRLEEKVLRHTKSLQENDVRNNIFLTMLPIAIIILNEEGRIVEFNAAAERMFGHQRENMLNKLAAHLVIPEKDKARCFAILEEVKNNPEGGVLTSAPLELPAIRADGTEFSMEITLSSFVFDDALFYTAAILDVTQQKATAQKLAALASFPEENNGPVLRINNRNVIEYSNFPGLKVLESWRMNVGDELTGVWAQIFHNVYAENVQQLHEHVIGDKIYMLRLVPIQAGGYVNVYGTDQTIQKAYEHELVVARDLAEQSNKAKSEFLAMMSHEIRTPMNGVMGMTELLQRTKLGDKQTRYANNIMKSAVVLLRIIDDVLDISKIEADKLELENEVFNLITLMRDVESMFRENIKEKKLKLRVILSSELPDFIQGDSGRLRQILINLISNAIKFTKVGEIKVSVFVVESTIESTMLHFEVMDTGIGMDENTTDRIFDSFSQADQSTTRVYGGTGLGLAIVKKLVALMKGDIGVTSELGKGACFWFDLEVKSVTKSAIESMKLSPQSDLLVENGGEKRAQEANAQIQGLEILLAEDNLVNQEVVTDMLESLGYKVDVVVNGREAVAAVKSKQYNMVLMDCRMPEMDGYEATRCIRKFERENDSERPMLIIALTANAMLTDIEKCKQAGMDDFIAKPFLLSDFNRFINMA